MNGERRTPHKTHFHIHWIKTDRLDWVGFDSHNEALSRGLKLARTDELFAIEEVSEPCRVCEAKDTSD